jgi:PAS domain S-box-containing protein
MEELEQCILDPDLYQADAMPPIFGGGDMGNRVRRKDWSRTSLGSIDTWPQSLRTAVGICLNSQFAMFVWWAPDLINIYNDAYATMLGKRHPNALGMPAEEIWTEIWSILTADVQAVVERGESISHERVRLVLERNGYPEETYFTYSYGPIPDDHGGVGGLFAVCTDETARVLAERERDLFAGQRQLALDAAAMGWWRYDPITQISSYDRRYTEIFRVEGNEKPNEEILKRIHPDDLPGVWAAVTAALDPVNPKPYSAEYRIFHPDGSTRWIEAHGTATFEGEEDSRHAISLVGTVADITARKRDSEQSRVILESITDGFFALDREWRFTYINPQGERLLDRTANKLLGNVIFQVYTGIPGTDIEQVYRRAAAGTACSVTSFYADHDRWYEIHAYPAPEGISVYFRDVTQRMRADEALRESNILLQAISDSTDDVIFAKDIDGRLRYANPATLLLLGKTLDQVLGKTDAELLGDESAARSVMENDRRIMQTGISEEIEERVPLADGSHRVWVSQKIPNRDASGKVIGLLGVSRDITDRKQSEEAKQALLDTERQARADADRASRMKDEFLATLSHELRTPLNAIMGWAAILSSDQATEEDRITGMETILRNAQVQTRIIEELLDMSRIVSGKIRLDVQQISLVSVVQAAIDTVRPAADAKNVRIIPVLDPYPGPLSGDPNRLQQVFWNLLSNAVKFTPKGGQVQVVLERVHSQIEVRIADSGEGIRSDFLPFVFDRFRQADASTTRRHGGLGLGLAIVKQLVELHGGTVGVSSRGTGEGATFSVIMPVAAVQPQAEPAVQRRHPLVDSSATKNLKPDISLNGVRVLVVDDETDARDLVKRLLEDCDAQVKSAATAAEAIAVLCGEKFDVVVSDIGMPGEDGYSLIRRIRQLPINQGKNTPAIALTAYASAQDRVKSITAGFQNHIAKPVDPAELIAMVASLAGRV